MKKKLLIGASALFVVLILFYWQLITYGLKQARGQLKVIIQSRPTSEVLLDPTFPDSLKRKIELINLVKEFAVDSLGLYESDNYTTLFDQQGKPILWNLSASDRFELKPFLWDFPFLGSMPYKGFFNLEEAKKEEQSLIERGYDTRVRTVSGWSTLGILNDPILSNMLERPEGQLTEVIIHELTHATVFIKNEVNFNENLASFIGEEGAIQFLKIHFGDSSKQLIDYLHSESDNRALKKHLLRGSNQLQQLYKHLDQSLTDDEKETMKKNKILEITSALDTVRFYNDRYYRLFDNQLPNNAYFMAHIRYHAQEDSLQMIHDQYGSLKKMITGLKKAYGK